MAKSTQRTGPELAQWIIARNADLLAERAPWDAIWQELGDFFLPRKADITSKRENPDNSDYDALYDGTALQAAATLANGSLAYITPADSRWFAFEPPKGGGGKPADVAKQWYSQCSEDAQFFLATSNFYGEIHELNYDDAVFGTYCMHVRPGRSSPLIFTKFDIGSFALEENDEGEITTCFREFELTVSQAAEQFGEKNISEKLRRALEMIAKTGKGSGTKYPFIHAMYWRSEKDRQQGKEDGANKPWASVYVEVGAKHVCRNSGYDAKPFFAGRHIKSSQGVYGWSPAWLALPDARQLNFLTKQLDALAEIKAFPRFLIPAGHEGEIDLRANGGTYFDPAQPNAIPREWMTQGDYQIGLEREKRKSESIERAMHTDLFRMFSSLDKQMTATEVAERASEKLAQFSPSFALKTTELLTPCLRSVFSILLRRGLFEQPPQEATVNNAVPMPSISYISRVALAIRTMQNLSFARTLDMLAPLIQLKPEALDNFQVDVISRGIARNSGMAADWIAEEKDVEAIREARAEAQAKMEQQQQLLTAAEAAGKAGSVKNDSVLGSVIGQQQQ